MYYNRNSDKNNYFSIVIKKNLLSIYILLSSVLLIVVANDAQAAPQEPFIDISEQANISAAHDGSWDQFSQYRDFTDGYLATGQAWADYNNDGWVDLYVTGGLTTSVLYDNNGPDQTDQVTFSVSPLSQAVSLLDTYSGGAVWADYDNDGWKDLYVLVYGANVLFHNDEGRSFTDVTALTNVGDMGKGSTAAWGDYDQDGYLDLFVTNWSCFPKCDPVDHSLAQDRLYHSNGPDENGNVTFEDASHLLDYDKLIGAGFSTSFLDFDNDGDLDIYVVNDKLHNPIGNVLWRNDGPDEEGTCGGWCWTDASTETGTDIQLHGMGLAVGDYDNDRDLDLHFTNMVDPNGILQNQGDGFYTDVIAESGLPTIATNAVSWGTAFFDYDNDGWLDIYYATTEFRKFSAVEGPLGMMFPFPNALYHNNGANRKRETQFDDATPPSWIDTPQRTMGFAYADYDRDGLLDFVQANWDQGYRLYRNSGAEDAPKNRWLTLRLRGAGPVNRDAIGARVYLMMSNGQRMMQEIKSGSSLGAGNDTALHFGLGNGSPVPEQMTIIWPNGRKETRFHIPINRTWVIEYPTKEPDPILERLRQAYPEPFVDVSELTGIKGTHDASWRMFKPEFTTGYLGIGQAWGDYDRDGWLDLYVTGNRAPNVLYHNNGPDEQGDVTFTVSALSESVSLPDSITGGAVWIDYDNDGWKDLYVLAHGPNTLYHNEQGQGLRDVTELAGVGDPGKGSTATWGDYDNDGYLDLFVANWSCYPECDPVDSTLAQDRLYHNQGPDEQGNVTFADVSHTLRFEKLLGAGFTASFVDYDNDGDSDIYVVNDALMNPVGNVLWRNEGPDIHNLCGGWCWTDVSAQAGAGTVVEGMGLAVGDYDNDLDLDFYFSNMVNPSALLQNQGDGTFIEAAKAAQVGAGPRATVGWGTSFFDYDNDGWLDLYMSTTEFRNLDRGTPPDGMHFDHPNFLYRNNQDGTFNNASPASWLENPQRSMGIAYADYDQDGWVDFVTGDWGRGYTLYQNQAVHGADHNWLSIRLIGSIYSHGAVNRDGLGARVYLKTSAGHVQMQEVKSGSSLGAGNDTALHFGLGRATADWVTVRWPDGTVALYEDVPSRGRWQLMYGLSERYFVR